jgi:hypothetical protein
MPKNDALKALLEITVWIESLNNEGEIRLDNRFAVLRLLDETARPNEIKVLREYFSTAMNSPVHEKRLWIALDGYYTHLSAAYHSVLAGCHDGDKGASSLHALMPLIVARGINAIAGCLKCAAVHYVPVRKEIWEQLAEYYTEAETENFLDDEFELYPGASAVYPVRHQIAGLLLWWASGTGSLKPLQIHLSERLTAHLCRSLVMGAEPGEDSLFYFDLAQPRPPMRYDSETMTHPDLRFIGQGGVRLQIEPLIEKLENGMVPGEVNLGGTYDAASVCEMARRLAANWLDEPPSRRNVRRSITVNMDVVKGFPEVIDLAHHGSSEVSSTTWMAEDISATGFRCVLEITQGAGVKIGTLIGFKPENMQYWGAGIVRRLRRDEQDKLDVGIEILTSRLGGVMLSEEGSFPDFRRSGESPAIWLGRTGPNEGEARVLTKPGTFSENHVLQVYISGKRYTLVPEEQAVKNDDYDLMHYRMIEREA